MKIGQRIYWRSHPELHCEFRRNCTLNGVHAVVIYIHERRRQVAVLRTSVIVHSTEAVRLAAALGLTVAQVKKELDAA